MQAMVTPEEVEWSLGDRTATFPRLIGITGADRRARRRRPTWLDGFALAVRMFAPGRSVRSDTTNVRAVESDPIDA